MFNKTKEVMICMELCFGKNVNDLIVVNGCLGKSFIQSGPLPVRSKDITPLIGVINQVTYL